MNERRSSVMWGWLPRLLILTLAAGITDPAYSLQHGIGAERSEVAIPIQSFSLIDQAGRPFNLDSLQGRIMVVDFAYTTCPDVCPLMTAALRIVQTRLSSAEKKSVYFLTITTDPEIDRPKVMAAYAGRYHADLENWSFLTGGAKPLAAVWKNFGVKVKRKGRGLIEHTTLTGLVDASKTFRVAYHGAAPDPEIILGDLRALLVHR
jgi:protein SCO1